MFDPVVLPHSGLELANRLVMAPMPTFAANADGSVGLEELKYYKRRARGLGAVITAGCAVSPEAVSFAGQWRCDSDALLPSLRAVAETIGASAVPVLQLSHGGNLSDRYEEHTVIDLFGAAARRAQQAGFSAIEIHGGHRYLVHQFFSRRNSASRTRLPLAIVAACRQHLPCWYRLDPEEPGPDGITFEETTDLVGPLVEAGVDVIDVSAKRYQQGSIINAADTRPRAALLAQQVGDKAAVMAVGGIETPVHALHALSDGCALIGLGSILLPEPDWAGKVKAGDPLRYWAPPPTSDNLVTLAVPVPVVRYLVKRGRVSDGD